MLTSTNYTVNSTLFQEACSSLPKEGMKTTINQPTGDFCYDPWVIKDEYKGTVWEALYNSLPVTKGEARIIILDPAHCYQIHADIDDRYHLNILGDNSYLIDLVKDTMYPLTQDGIWYDMDASFLHTATNFGRRARVQLVVRKLLKKNKLINPVEITIDAKLDTVDHSRFALDNCVSPWLNLANKNGIINNFSFSQSQIKFNIEKDHLDDLKNILPTGLELT